jgi:hypothetical protein
MPNDAITAVVTRLLGRAPDWIRKDLASKDALTRTRAEEALAALISAALSAKREEPGEG